MKILIGQSYFRILDPKELERKMPYPPLGALYAASLLKNSNHEVIFFDAMLAESTEDFNNLIINEEPDIVLIYDDEFNYLTKMCLSNMRDAAISFIKEAKQKNIPTIIYSSDATDYSKYYLDAGVDYIIYGEGEKTLEVLIEYVEKDNIELMKLNIDGLIFSDNSETIKTKSRVLEKDLDSIPDPDYSFVDMAKYKSIWIDNHGYYSINVSTTRGCPFKCNWCAKPLYGKTYYSRSPKRVANQMKQLQDKYGIDHVWITDDIFGLKPNWINEFAAEIKNLDLHIPYKCLSRPDLLVKDNTISDLQESGCKTIWIGAESGSQNILDAMDKGTTVKQIYKAAELVHNAKMEIAFFIQFGYTGEVWKDIASTRKMIVDCLPDDIGISVSYPLPGTPFYNRVKEQLQDKTNWTDSDDLDMMFSGSYERGFYKLLHRLVHSEYRLAKILKNKSIGKLPHLIIHAIRFVKYRFMLNPFLKKVNEVEASVSR